MFFNFLIGALAGFLVPYAEPMVKTFIEKVALEKVALDPNEFDMLSLIALLLGAVAVTLLLGFSTNAFLLIIGAGFGVFAKRLYALFTSRGQIDYKDDSQ